jgi:hypothetical protein
LALLGRLPSAGANICVAARASQKPAHERTTRLGVSYFASRLIPL